MKNARTILTVFSMTTLLLGFTGCSDDPQVEPQPEKNSLSVKHDSMNFNYDDTKTVTVEVVTDADGNFKAESQQEWIKITDIDQTARTFKVGVGLFDQMDAEPRNGKITVSAGNAVDVEIAVKQTSQKDPGFGPDPEYTIEVDPKSLIFGAAQNLKQTVTVTCESDVKFVFPENDNEWLDVALSGTTLTVTVKENPDYENGRASVITLSAEYAEDVELPVEQEAAEEPEPVGDPDLQGFWQLTATVYTPDGMSETIDQTVSIEYKSYEIFMTEGGQGREVGPYMVLSGFDVTAFDGLGGLNPKLVFDTGSERSELTFRWGSELDYVHGGLGLPGMTTYNTIIGSIDEDILKNAFTPVSGMVGKLSASFDLKVSDNYLTIECPLTSGEIDAFVQPSFGEPYPSEPLFPDAPLAIGIGETSLMMGTTTPIAAFSNFKLTRIL